MVLPASSSDAEPGSDPLDRWIERITNHFRLIRRGTIVLVDDPRDTQLGPLVRGLARDFPHLWVLTEAAQLNDVPEGAVIVLVTRAEDATWLNLNRPIFADRSFKVVLWNKRSVSEFLVRKAPDFWDWVSRRFEAPQGPAAFAVRGFHMALRARAWAVDFRGRTLDEVFGAAFPKRKLIRVSATAPDDLLRKAIKDAGTAWIAWTNVLDERGALRIRGIVAGAHRRGRNILENAHGTAPDAWPVFDALMNLPQAIGALEAAGLASAGRLGAMLDLEPEAISLAAEALARGIGVAELEKAILEGSDPGVALEKRVIEGADFDPVRIAGCRVPPPMLRAFGMDTRVREARAKMRGGSGPTLAPLAERITGGYEEFELLMRPLLRIYAGRRAASIDWDPRIQPGIDALLSDGPLHLGGAIAVSYYWPDDRRGFINSALLRPRHTWKIRRWILVSPDLTPFDVLQFRTFPIRERIPIDLWRQTEIENLLRKCPPLLARYYPEEARPYLPGYDGTDFHTLASQYRAKIANHYNRLKTIGIPPEARPRESRIELPLAKLFISLRLVPEEKEAEPQDLARILVATKNGVILADPGMGKSTLLAYLALVFAGGAPMAEISGSPQMVPMHISLRDFVRRQKLQPGLSFLDYLELDARERFGLSNMHRAFFEATLYMGEAMVLLDGLDEVGNETARHALAAAIRSFAADYPASRFWVTSRIYGYTENVRLPKTFDHYRIARLEKEQIDDFVKRWYRHQLGGEPKEADEQAASLSAAIEKTAGVKRLAGNPLLLTLMAFIHQGLRKLPKDRGELYDKCIEMLLKTWGEAKRGDDTPLRGTAGLTLDVFTQKDYLAHLAFFVQQRNQSGIDDETRGLISRHDAVQALARRHVMRARRERPELTEAEANGEMGAFLDYVCDETGLLLDRGNDQISFIHLSFQEYLAAWVFLCGTDLPKGASFFLEHLGDPAWEEVLLLRLYIVLRGGGGGVDEFDLIVGAILRALERKSIAEGWLTLVRAIRDDLEFREGDRKEILRRAVGYWLQEAILIGQWHEALEEVNLFGERAQALLHDLITTMRIQASAQSELLHLLRLETELYGFPDDAPTRLKVRTDLTELLESLIRYFAKQPLLRPIFAEHATLANWARGMRPSLSFDGYHLLVRWMSDPPSAVAMQAGMAMLWQKVLQTFDLLVTYADMSTTEFSARSFGLHNAREVQATATAWDELCKTFTNPTSPTAAFVITHAAYAALISKRECKIPFTPELQDPCVHFSHLLYERCISRNPETNAKAIEQTLANPPAELRPLLEAVELIKPAAEPSAIVRPVITTDSPAPQALPPERVLFSWLHLADMHFGHRNTSHRWNQKLVIETLHEDLTKLRERDIPIPESMFVTGDIAFSGSAEQYAEGSIWLDKVAATLAITRERIFVVPGNHDIDRTVDRNDRNVARLIRGLRDGDDLVDEILENKSDRALLASRMAAYLAFAARYPALQSPDPLYWSHVFVTPNGLPVRVIGLPTALLAAGDIDHGKLRLGQMPLASTLTDAHKDRELVLVLTHHPLRGGWLADQRDTDGWVQNRAHVHLFGHVHEADSEAARSGSGSGILRIAAGAVHGDMLPADIPASHGYALGAVIARSDEPLRVRIWPRLWSEPNKEFRVDVHNVPDGKTFADHPLDGRLKVKGA